ncbi:hypothetical protein [Parvibaculum sp.]|jgi:hypothetical protein|uniref:hypothetical protein n=1 Tax=Parvibaculum sp. TaxID=2024848 RepID=UPI001B1D1025|nr:hypothetical protein [Parvibaculum sp.]MBO6666987.1 hypothetical protein [Parvibaculum sp.]MBO6690431.1 hypothetical protein [Parvibaculum sp.]MBO6713608.1 hypothetical protein [Parvibaculum sp.]
MDYGQHRTCQSPMPLRHPGNLYSLISRAEITPGIRLNNVIIVVLFTVAVICLKNNDYSGATNRTAA